ncbi:MAG: hypothetical protein ACAH17_02490 [Candidatus Paceibacterota bacterium]
MLKQSNRKFVEKRPIEFLFCARTLPEVPLHGDFVLEEVLDGLWNSSILEVKNQCIKVLTSYRFIPTSKLSTRAMLRDTLLHDGNAFGNEKVYERLFLVYLRYSTNWWPYTTQRPSDISEVHVLRRRKRVASTAYALLSKLYCREYEDSDELRFFAGLSCILSALIKHLVEAQRIRRDKERLTDEESHVLVGMLNYFARSFGGSSRKDPFYVGEGTDREFVLIARLASATFFWNVDVEQSFKRLLSSAQKGMVLPHSQPEGTGAEYEIAKRRLLAGIEVICDTLKENRLFMTKKSKQDNHEGWVGGHGDCGVA